MKITKQDFAAAKDVVKKMLASGSDDSACHASAMTILTSRCKSANEGLVCDMSWEVVKSAKFSSMLMWS